MDLATGIEHVDWSRLQFAVTAMFHFIFVPLTLGLGFIVAIMETIYVKTGDEYWKMVTKFWMKLFAINFVVGVSTGLIMEFQFGTNWSNYSWLVGDIFGAPLAIEGIVAFFLEATFFAVMFFGWDKISKGAHLFSTWMVAIGANLSALWILVANGWMTYPVGAHFNPETARNEMLSFAEILFSPVAITKFLHTVASGYVVAALFVVGISAWYLLKGRETQFAKRSIAVAAAFGLITSIFLAMSGDESGYEIAQKQPMKMAAMEGLYDGQTQAGVVALGMLTPGKRPGDDREPFLFDIYIPYALSFMGYRDINAFVPGINDLVYGNPEQGIPAASELIERGNLAQESLAAFHDARDRGDEIAMSQHRSVIEEHAPYIGYGYLSEPTDIVPPVALTFYSFRVMVGLGVFFIVLFAATFYFLRKNTLENKTWFLRLCVLSIPLGFIAAQAGWLVAEVGRQPWAIQDLLPVQAAATSIGAGAVQITFWLFVLLFIIFFIAGFKIMLRQIVIGPQGGK
ncbi:cytochrome ubiquinol oxidase subunit I [Desulfurispira natronophila]|uniref:Cytochrome d ubiquinol oxidase subunit I n=1 Tax=Desulfurispira natronophila TaxID=682562 RepID=A0A7W7Y5D0_9BACT|nr:cytochrome ubiquinol oxidase subunit I [Desulfurispira natronophila]MBB5022297.1 cytochrome d ubiquinol oxidase subunit I [Desulfurispira natronophila]